jgi:hypothetical protein
MNIENLLQTLTNQLIETHQAEHVHILPDNRLAGKPGADFLLQIDDYDMRLLLLDPTEGTPTINETQISDFLSLLEDNPSTLALILVWKTNELPSIPLSMARVRFLSQNPNRIQDLKTKPLSETLQNLVAQQVKLWEVNPDQVAHTEIKLSDTRRLFEEAIAAAIERECQRAYHNAERKLAAQHFPEEEEKRRIFEVLGEALNGVQTQDLVPRLTRLSRRGG